MLARLSDTEQADLFNQLPSGILYIDYHEHILIANPAMAKMMNTTVDQLQNKKFSNILHAEDTGSFKKQFNKSCKDHQLAKPIHCRIIPVNKPPVYVELKTVNMTFREKEAVMIMINEIDYKKTADKTHFESESKYKAIVQSINYGITYSDPAGKILHVNEAFSNITGIPAEKVLGRNSFSIAEALLSNNKLTSLFDQNQKAIRYSSKEPAEITYNGKILEICNYTDPITAYTTGIIRDITDYKKMMNEIREKEKLYRTLIETSPDGITLTDLQGRIISANKQSLKLMGFKDVKQANAEAYSVFHSIALQDRHKAMQNMELTMNEGKALSKTYTLVRRDGSTVPVELSAALIRDEHGEPEAFMAVTRDISERVESEKALKKSENKFRRLFEYHDAVKILLEPDTGKILDANKAALEYYGYGYNQIMQMTIHQLDGQSEEKVKELITRARASRQLRFEVLHRLCGGIKREVSIYVSPIEIGDREILHLTIYDITDKKKSEINLVKLRQAIEQSPVSVLIMDLKGKIEYANHHYLKTRGFALDEIKGQKPDFIYGNIHPSITYKQILKSVLQTNTWNGEVKTKTKSGKSVWENILISCVRNKEAKINGFILVSEDITEKKKMWDYLVEAKNKAEESDRVKSAFLATMSHELRTPLNHIIGFSDLIMANPSEAENRDYAEMIYESGSKLLEIFEDIFHLALADHIGIKTKKEPLSVGSVYIELQDSLKEVLYRSGKSGQIKLLFHLENKLSDKMVHSDKSKIIQIMLNLFKNAVKFTENGEIRFEINLTKKDQLSFHVHDTGIGFPEEKKNVIFDFFRQLDDSHTRQHDGLGVGLSISKKLAEAMNGVIIVSSTPNEGSHFCLHIPVQILDDENMPDEQSDTYETLPDLSGKKILIAEDDFTSRFLVKTQLEDSKATILEAENGQEAIAQIQAIKDVSLILMDLKMPVMNGFDASRQIRSLHPHIPILALTSYTSVEEKELAMKSGCNDLMTKPVNKLLLFKKIRMLINKET